jgi:hypothetical protein
MMTLSDQHPKPRYRRGDVPDGFTPMCIIDQMGRHLAQYRCSKRVRTLTGETRQCCSVGRKNARSVHKRHDFTLSEINDLHIHEFPSQSPNRRKLNERIILIAAATNRGCHQAASPTTHNFIIALLQVGASLPREKLLRIVQITPLVDRITDVSMDEAVR